VLVFGAVGSQAGTDGPFFNATTTFEPMASPVPWPPALALLQPELLLTVGVAARQRHAAAGG
jgi:hypothetical protein